MKITDKEMKDMEDFYSDGILAWHDKGEKSEEDIVRLINYIRHLETKLKNIKEYYPELFLGDR